MKIARVVGIGVAFSALVASVGLAEEDQLLGFIVKDTVQATSTSLGGATVTNQQYGPIGTSCATTLKPKFLFVQGNIGGPNDPRGGPAGKFICYKAKCATPLTSIVGNDDFSAPTDHSLEIKKAKLYCRPFVDTTAPRFVDNGDGTVTDTQTRLMWEKKDNLGGGANLSDPHDADNTYKWSTGTNKPDGTAYTDFLGALNGGTSPDGTATSGCFTGHCDWRLPTIEELAGIVDATQGNCGGGSGPCIDPIFGPTQGLSALYWSATTLADPSGAWSVDFGNGSVVGNFAKVGNGSVRAVRGGS